MPKRARKHPGEQGHSRPRPARPHKERVNFSVDAGTMKILDKLVKVQPELDSRSAAIRYLARWYDRMAEGKDVIS
jgi:hypothetical protein